MYEAFIAVRHVLMSGNLGSYFTSQSFFVNSFVGVLTSQFSSQKFVEGLTGHSFFPSNFVGDCTGQSFFPNNFIGGSYWPVFLCK